MKHAATLFCLLGFASPAIAGTEASHCREDEEVFFSCAIEGSGKVVSLCGESDEMVVPVWLQYRFGRVGQVELAFPEEKAGSLARFGGLDQSAKSIGATIHEVWFRVGAYDYLIEHGSGGDCDGACVESNGLVVFRRGAIVERFTCQAPVTHRLGLLYGHISGDQAKRP